MKPRPPARPEMWCAQPVSLTSLGGLDLHQAFHVVLLAERRLVDLAGGVSRDRVEDDAARPLVAGQLRAELKDLLLCAGAASLQLDDGRRDLPEALVGQSDDRYVLDRLPLMIISLARSRMYT